MKNAWNRNVLMISARTNAMRIEPGQLTEESQDGFMLLGGVRVRSGSGASIESRSTVFTGQGYRLAARARRSAASISNDTSTALNDAHTSPPSRRSEPSDGARGDLRGQRRRAASRTRARSPSIAISAIASAQRRCARNPLARGVQRHVDRAEHGEHAVAGMRASLGDAPRRRRRRCEASRAVVERLQRPGEQVHAHQVGHVARSEGACGAPRGCRAA